MTAAWPQCAGDLAKRPRGIKHVFHYVLCDMYIETRIGESEGFQVLAAHVFVACPQGHVGKKLRWEIAWAFALQTRAHPAIAWRGLVNSQILPIGKISLQSHHQGALAGYFGNDCRDGGLETTRCAP